MLDTIHSTRRKPLTGSGEGGVTSPQPTAFPFFPSFGSPGGLAPEPLTVNGENQILPVIDAPVESWAGSDVHLPTYSKSPTTTYVPVIERLVGQAAQSPNNRLISERVRPSRPLTEIGDTLAAASRVRPLLLANLPPASAGQPQSFLNIPQPDDVATDTTTIRYAATKRYDTTTRYETTTIGQPSTTTHVTQSTPLAAPVGTPKMKYRNLDSCDAINCDFEGTTCGFEGTEGVDGAWTVVQGRVGDELMGIGRAAFGNSLS